jgi:hypothetical protein
MMAEPPLSPATQLITTCLSEDVGSLVRFIGAAGITKITAPEPTLDISDSP